MPEYEYNIRFEAESDEEAHDVIFNENYGVTNSFETIVDDKLTDSDGNRVESP